MGISYFKKLIDMFPECKMEHTIESVKSYVKKIRQMQLHQSNIDINDIRFKQPDIVIVAWDASLLIHKLVASAWRKGNFMFNQKGEEITYAYAFFTKIVSVIKEGVLPIIVFDSKPSSMKDATTDMRYKKRIKATEQMNKYSKGTNDYNKYKSRTFRPTHENYLIIMKICDLMGVPYLTVPEGFEAEILCTWLATRGPVNVNKQNNKDNQTNGNNKLMSVYPHADLIFCDDGDALAFGAPHIIRNTTKKFSKELAKEKSLIIISLQKLCDQTRLTYENLVNLFSMMGNDYNDNLENIGPVKCLEIIQICKNIETYRNLLYINGDLTEDTDQKLQKMISSREYFKNSLTNIDNLINNKQFIVYEDNVKIRCAQEFQLNDFLVESLGISPTTVQNYINLLTSSYKKLGVIRPNNGHYHDIIESPFVNLSLINDFMNFDEQKKYSHRNREIILLE